MLSCFTCFSVRSPPLSIGDVVAAEPPHPVAVLREHPPVDRVGEPPEAVELQLEQPRRIIEGRLAADRDDGLHGPGNRGEAAGRVKRESRMWRRRNSATAEELFVG